MITTKQQFVYSMEQNNVYEQFLTNFDKKEAVKQQFIHFLKQNNVYEQFIINFDKREGERNKACPKSQYLSEMEPERFIDRAFTWRHTEGGWLYWYNLSVKWQIFYSKIK